MGRMAGGQMAFGVFSTAAMLAGRKFAAHMQSTKRSLKKVLNPRHRRMNLGTKEIGFDTLTVAPNAIRLAHDEIELQAPPVYPTPHLGFHRQQNRWAHHPIHL
jgi:hypothetical protein